MTARLLFARQAAHLVLSAQHRPAAAAAAAARLGYRMVADGTGRSHNTLALLHCMPTNTTYTTTGPHRPHVDAPPGDARVELSQLFTLALAVPGPARRRERRG